MSAERNWAVGSRGSTDWLEATPSTYAGSGVDRAAGASAVNRLAVHARTTFGPEVVSDIGGFGGLFALPTDARGDSSLLVASSDGVGTKSLLSTALRRFDTIGQDLVAMNVDDIVVYGATPLFVLDYLVVGSVSPDMVEDIISGVAAGCRIAGCALLGGEVAEHPATMSPGEFDLAGFVIGTVTRERLITGDRIAPGAILVGIAAQGMRSDGYSFVRKIFADRNLDSPAYPGAEHSLGQELLRPSRIYAPAVLRCIDELDVLGIAHVTGGGIATNIARILPDACDALVVRDGWPVPAIFGEMRRHAGVSPTALEDALPIGIGMVLIVPSHSDARRAIDIAGAFDHDAYVIGRVTAGAGTARFIDHWEASL